MYDRSNEAQGIHCVSPMAANKLGQLTSMHNPSHPGYYDRGPPTHFRHWHEHGYTPPYHYSKQHNGHHVRQFHPHHSNYHNDWHNHHAPHFHRPPCHSNPPSQIMHNHWRHAQPKPIPKLIIQRSSIREEKGKVLHFSGNSKSPPLYHVKTNSHAVSGPSPKDNGEINLPQERKLLTCRKEIKLKDDATAANEKLSEKKKLSELTTNKLAFNVVISNGESDKEGKEASSNASEGISQKGINSDNTTGQQGSITDATVTHSKNGGEIKTSDSNSDICLSKDPQNNLSNPLIERDNSKKEESMDMKKDFSAEDSMEKMEFIMGKSYNMKNCKRNSLARLKKRYPELQKLFGKDPIVKLRRLSAAKIASYEQNISPDSKGHGTGSVSDGKGLELNKENKSSKGIPVDPKVMSLSRTLQNPPNGKKPVETIFKCTASRLKSASPFPKTKRDTPKISYTDLSKLKMKLKNVEVPRSQNVSSRTSHNIKRINPEPSTETKKKGSICLDITSNSVSLNENTQEDTIARFHKDLNCKNITETEESNYITAFSSLPKENESENQTCNSEISRNETEKCNLPGKTPVNCKKSTVSGQILSESMPALSIRSDNQVQENSTKLSNESTPSPPELQVVSVCSSYEPVEGPSSASNLGRQVDFHGESVRDKTILTRVKEKIMQKKETTRHSNSTSDLSKCTVPSESFDDRQKVDASDSKLLQKWQGEELKLRYDQKEVYGELHTENSCNGDITVLEETDINQVSVSQSDRDLTALCNVPVVPERHAESISNLPSDLDNSVTGESTLNADVTEDSTPYSAGEQLRTSEANQTVLDSCSRGVPSWQFNCSEEMLIAADTLLSVGNLPACGATETVGDESYHMSKSGFYQTEYVMCPEETVGLDLTVNSNTTKDDTVLDCINSVGENESDNVIENSEASIKGENKLVTRKRLKVGKGEKSNKDKAEKYGEEEESQACDSDATYIYSDSGEDLALNHVIKGVQERGKDGTLSSGNSQKSSDSKQDSDSTKHSSNTHKTNKGQKKGRERSNYVIKNEAKDSSSQFVENNSVSNGAEQKRKRKFSQDKDMEVKRKRASPSLKVVIGKVYAAKVNEGQVNKNADGENRNDSSISISESKEIKSKKAKDSKKIAAKEKVNVKKKKHEAMKKTNDVKDLNWLSIDKGARNFPDVVPSGSFDEDAEEMKKLGSICTKTALAKGTDNVSRRGKRRGSRRGGIARADIFQEDTGPQQSAEEGKTRRGKGSRGGRGRGQRKYTRVVKRLGKDLQIHLNEVLHHGEDSDDLPTILPPKRRRRLQQTPSHQSSDKMDRIMAEFPKHNWLVAKYQTEPEDLSLNDNKKKLKVHLDEKIAQDHHSVQPLTAVENLGADQKEPQSSDLPTNLSEPEKENKDNDAVTEEDSFESPLYIDMDSVNEKEVDEDSPTPKQHPLDLCVKKNDMASVTFRQHSNPPVQLVYPHVHRPPATGSLGQPSTVSSILLRDTKNVLSDVVVSSDSSDTTQGIVTKISTGWTTSATGSAMTGTNGDLASEIIDLGKSIQVPKNLLKQGALQSSLCNDTSEMQLLHDNCGEKEAISDTKLESNDSKNKFVQPAVTRLIPASSIVSGSNFSPSQHNQNHDIVLLPVSLSPSTDTGSEVDQRQYNASNSQVIQVEKAVSMENGAANVSENGNLVTSQERTPKLGVNDEQCDPNAILCSSTVQLIGSSNEANIISVSTDSTTLTTRTTISCISLLPEGHSASVSSNPGVSIIGSSLVASDLSQGSLPATSIGSLNLTSGSDIDICEIKSNTDDTKSESISNDIFLSTVISETQSKNTKIEMKLNSSVNSEEPSSESVTVGAGLGTHTGKIKSDIYFSDKNSADAVLDNMSENVANSTLDVTEGEPPSKKFCEYPSSKEPPPLMMVQTLMDAQSTPSDQAISYLANDSTMGICSPVDIAMDELDPEIQKQLEELDKRIQQNEKEKQEMLTAKRKMAELMEKKKREKLEEQVKVVQKEEQQLKPIENLPVQTQVGIQDSLNHLPLSDPNQANLKVSNSHQEQTWSKYQPPYETSCQEQESAALQEPTSEQHSQQQELPQPHSLEKQTPSQSPTSLYQPPVKQDQQQKQKEQQQEQTPNQQLLHMESSQQQATPQSHNVPEQQQQPTWQQRPSMPQHSLLHDKPSLLQQPSSPGQLSQASQVSLQHPFPKERAASQSHPSAENILPQIQPQQPLSLQQNHTSLKQMMKIQNPQQQHIQGLNIPRQQLLHQQLFSSQHPNQIAGNQLQQQQLINPQRFHSQHPVRMQQSQTAQMQPPAHLQHGFPNQYHPLQHPSLTQQQQYSRTQQQNYWHHQTQPQTQQQQLQQNCVKNQIQSQTHSIAPGHSSVQTVQNLQRPNMQHQHQMQHYQQIHMQQQKQPQHPRPQLFQAKPSNFGNTFRMPASQQHEMQFVVMQNNSNGPQCNSNPMGPQSVSPCSAITGTTNVTPTIPRQISLAIQEAQKRKQFGLPEIQPAHCNNEKSMLRRDTEPPPPAHMNCVSLKKLMRKMDRNAMDMTSTMKASCPYLQRNNPISSPPLHEKKSGSNEMKAPAKAHSQPPFNIAGKLIVQQLPGKMPSTNRLINEDKETTRHSSVPSTPTSATLGVQLPPRASSASDRHLQRSQSISEIGQPTFTFHPNSPSSAILSRSTSSSQSNQNLSIQEESKITDKSSTQAAASLNSQPKIEGNVKFTDKSQAQASPAIQSQDAVAIPNMENTNIIDLTKEFSTFQNQNDLQKDDTEKVVQLELTKAIAKRSKQDLLNAATTGECWTQIDQQPSKVSHQMQGMKLPLGPNSNMVPMVNQPHAQQAPLQVSPVLASTPVNGIQNQQQQWQRGNDEMNTVKPVSVSPSQKQFALNQGQGLMMRPPSSMQVTAASSMLTVQAPSNRLPSSQGGRMPQLLPKGPNPMIRMIGSAAVPIRGGMMPPTAGNMQLNRPCLPQAVMLQGSYRMNQQHVPTQIQYQNPEIMRHRTRQYHGVPRSGIMPPQQMPLQASIEINQDSSSCAQPMQQQPPVNPSTQANAFTQNRQQPQQIAPSQQSFVPMSYQHQMASSQARYASMGMYVTSSGPGQHMHTQNSMITGNDQLPNRPGKMGNTAPQTNPVTSTSQPVQIVSTSQPAQIVSTSQQQTTISTQIVTSTAPSGLPITSQTTNNMFPKEVQPTSNKTEPHLQQINGSCVMCGNFSLYLCSCCKKMWYCSPQCQLKHWTTHSLECRESTTT